MFSSPAIPVETNRRALECEGEQESEAVANCHNTGGFDDMTHSIGGEYAEVEEEEADLCERYASDVEELLDVETLEESVLLWVSWYGRKSYIKNPSNASEFESPHILSEPSFSN
jgi:hypothetical protein